MRRASVGSMAGKRARSGKRPLDELVRLACSTDPIEPETHPRRLAIAPRAAIIAGVALIALALLLALRAVALAPSRAGQDPSGAQATAAGSSARAGQASAPGSPPPLPPGAQQGPVDDGAGHTTLADPMVTAAPGAGQASGRVVVHVAGAVHSPGVVVLSQGSRVVDAIEAAGGATAEADTDQLNLARVLADGEQVRVPRIGEVLPAQDPAHGPGQGRGDSGAAAASGAPGDSGGAAGPSSQEARININTATASQLEDLPGIGPALAQRIVEHRDSHGPFASVDDLTDVPGIGQAKLDALRQEATV